MQHYFLVKEMVNGYTRMQKKTEIIPNIFFEDLVSVLTWVCPPWKTSDKQGQNVQELERYL